MIISTMSHLFHVSINTDEQVRGGNEVIVTFITGSSQLVIDFPDESL